MTDLQKTIIEVMRNGKYKTGNKILVDYAQLLVDHIRPLYDAGIIDGNSAFIKEIFLEAQGGECPACGQRWIPVRVKNKLVEYTYYKPACHCYPVCPYCGKILIQEVIDSRDGCINCMVGETGRALVIHCDRWTEETETRGKKKIKRRQKCSGIMKPVPGGWRCDVCGEEKRYNRVYKTWEEIIEDEREAV